MELSTLRLAIVGYGNIGRTHHRAATLLPGLEVVAIVDPFFADRPPERSGPLLFSEHRSLFAEAQIDIVCITAPAKHHRIIAEDAAKAGIHVLCEKPLAGSSADARSIVKACKAAGVLLGYGATYRFMPAIRAARELVRAQRIGAIRVMRESVIGGSGVPSDLGETHYALGRPGGGPLGLFDHGVHLADIFRWFTGSETRRAEGRGNLSGGTLRTEYLVVEMECGAVGQLCYDDGTFAAAAEISPIIARGAGWTIEGSFSPGDLVSDPGHIDIHGTKGALRIYHYANLLFLRDEDGVRQVPCPGRGPPDHFATQLEAFADAVRTGRPFEPGGQDGVAALEMIESAYSPRFAEESAE